MILRGGTPLQRPAPPVRYGAQSRVTTSRPAQSLLPRRPLHEPPAALKGFGIPTSSPKNKCPCGSGNDYSACCQKLHKVQQLKAAGPEQLLRARFAAYTKKDWKYILRTTHSANPARQGSTSANGDIKTTFEQDVKVTMRWADVSNLKIMQVRSAPSSPQAEVDFQYHMKQLYELETGNAVKDPQVKVLSETAVFEVEDGEWRLVASRSNWDRNKLKMAE